MITTVYSRTHEGHDPELEFFRGSLVPGYERPERVRRVLEEIQSRGLGPILDLDADAGADRPDTAGVLETIAAVHSADYVDFVRSIFAEFQRELASAGEPRQAYALPYTLDRLGREEGLPPIVPTNASGRLGYYSFDTGTPFTAGTWTAAVGAARCALRAQQIAATRGVAFALCRPPGHHAHRAMCGGYCFFNNAAVAAEAYRRGHPAARIAILDVDYHHGNGTQSIYYSRDDTLVASIHGDPRSSYPYFLGHADEVGSGPGEGWNANFPLPHGTTWLEYAPVLDQALTLVGSRNPDLLIVSLGVDTFRGDRISDFRLESHDFLELGRLIGSGGLPTLFVMEGGYHHEIGTNVANVLEGFLSAR